MQIKDVFRLDSWGNIFTGLGGKRDKRQGGYIKFNHISEGDCEAIYAGDDIAAKIVDMLPEDMLREGFRLTSPDMDDEMLDDAVDYFERLVLTKNGNKFEDGLKWGRAYGGAGLFMAFAGDDKLDAPVDFNKIQTIKYLTLFNRYELVAGDIDGDPQSDNFGYPLFYTLNPRTGGRGDESLRTEANKRIHHTRIIRFDGAKLPRILFRSNNYWHDSIFNKLLEPIRDFQSAYSATSVLLTDFSQAVYKIKNLASIIASPDGQKIIKDRLDIIEQSRSVVHAAIVDADGEDFERKTTSLSGLDKTLDAISRKFTSATEYPHTILLGESPSGLGATGDSEKRDYYERVRSRQQTVLKPKLKCIFDYIFAAGDGPTRGVIPEKYDIEFLPLEHLSRKDEITARESQAKTDQVYIETGVLSPDEVALSRFSEGRYSYETEIDEDSRYMEGPGDVEGDEDPIDPANPTDTMRMDGCKTGRRKKSRKSKVAIAKR